MAETLSTFAKILQDEILPTIQDTLYAQNFILKELQGKAKDIKGKQFMVKMRTQRNRGSGFRGELATLPTAGARAFEEMSATLRYFYQSVSLTGQELAFSELDTYAVKFNIVLDAFDDARQSANDSINFAMWGDGSGRRIAVTSSAYSSPNTVVTCTAGTGSLYHIFKGMNVSFGSDTTEFPVVDIDVDAGTFTVTGDAHLLATSGVYVYASGEYRAAFDWVPWGIRIHLSDSNSPHSSYQGVDRSAVGYGWSKAVVKSNSGTLRPITDLLLNQFFAKLRTNGSNPELLVMDQGVYGSYAMFLQNKAVPINPVVSEWGYKDLSYVVGGKTYRFREALDAPANTIFAIDPATLELRQAGPLSWDKTGGTRLIPRETQHSAWGRMFWFFQLACSAPYHNGVLKDVKEWAIT